MKENVRSLSEKLDEKQENIRLNSVNSRKTSLQRCDWSKLIEHLHYFFLYIYKMLNVGKETYKNNNVEVIVDGIGTLWLNENHIEKKLGHKSLPFITNKYDEVYKKHRYDLVNEPKKQPNRRFLHSDLALKIIVNCRTDESCNLNRNFGFRLHDVINTNEQTILESIKDVFEGEDTLTSNSVLGYRIDLYFHKHNLAIEVSELGHDDRYLGNKIERQKVLEKELDCVFIKINPGEENFNIFKVINKIHKHNKRSTKNY